MPCCFKLEITGDKIQCHRLPFRDSPLFRVACRAVQSYAPARPRTSCLPSRPPLRSFLNIIHNTTNILSSPSSWPPPSWANAHDQTKQTHSSYPAERSAAPQYPSPKTTKKTTLTCLWSCLPPLKIQSSMKTASPHPTLHATAIAKLC